MRLRAMPFRYGGQSVIGRGSLDRVVVRRLIAEQGNASMISGIDHLVITVADIDATLDFYARVLDARIVRDEGKPAAMMLGAQKINVHQRDHTFEPKAARPTMGAGDFCLIADVSLDQVIDRLARNGVAIEEGPIARTGARGEMTSVYIRDPDANLVEIARYDG